MPTLFFTRGVCLKKVTAFLCASLSCFANPTGGTAVSGEVRIDTPSANLLQIQTSDQVIIDWQSFSIGAGEKTEFIQPSRESIAINRVVDVNPSVLFGDLYANGSVVLINPNGIVVGPDAVIDTASWIASTLDLNADLYLKTGELAFQGSSEAKILHEGVIRVKDVALLVGADVEVRGAIIGGKLAGVLAANQCLLKPAGDRRFFVRPAEGVKLEGGNAFASAFRHARVSGEIEAREVVVRGDEVVIELNAKIGADGVREDSGGTISIEGLQSVRAWGKMTACGGSEGGDGGRLEVVSGGKIDFGWKGDLSAPFGKNGVLRLDAKEVWVFPEGEPIELGALQTGIDPIQLGHFLQSHGRVEVHGVDLLSVAPRANIIWTSPNGLALSSDRTVAVHANIQNAGWGDISVQAVREILISPGCASVSVGSIYGHTSVGSPVCELQIIGMRGHAAQVGFYTESALCTGPISIHAGTLRMAGDGVGAFSGAHIGHGAIDAPCGVTVADAPISVFVKGDASLQGGGIRSPVQIGHGGLHGSRAGKISLEGEIQFRCEGRLNMGVPFESHHGTLAAIGHGFAGKTLSASAVDCAGNMSMVIGKDFALNPMQTGEGGLWLGHHVPVGGKMERAAGHIDLSVGGALVAQREGKGVFVGHFAPGGVDLIEGLVRGEPLHYRLNFAKDLQLPNHMVVGFDAGLLQGKQAGVFRGDVEVFAGGAIRMASGHIGVKADFSSQTRTFIVSGETIRLDGSIFSSGKQGIVRIAALKDIELNGAEVGTDVGGTHLYAGGSVRGAEANSRVGSGDFELCISAGGDIAVPSDFRTDRGSIRLMCGRDFREGNLWEVRDEQLVSVCGQSMAPVKTVFAKSSPAIQGFGAYTNRSKVCLETAQGDIWIACGHYNPRFKETMRFGTDADAQFEVRTENGNLQLGPFYDVVIDQELKTAAGDITVEALLNLSVANSVSTETGAIYLGAGNQLKVVGSISSSSGKISTFSGNDSLFEAAQIKTAGEILLVSGHDLHLKGETAVRSTQSMVTLVSDFAPPGKPLLNPGIFTAESGVRVDCGPGTPLRIFTAASEVLGFNRIDPSATFNGVTVAEVGYPVPMYENTDTENWFVWFESAYPYPAANMGRPFTIFYKYNFDFLEHALRRAQMLTSQAHPGLFSYPHSSRRLNPTLLKNTRFPDHLALSR